MKTKLTKTEIEHLAKLVGLKLTDEEIDRIGDQLSSVIDYFEELKKVDTSKVVPTSQTTGLVNITRSDVIKNQPLLIEDALYNASDTYNNMFKVPIILKKD